MATAWPLLVVAPLKVAVWEKEAELGLKESVNCVPPRLYTTDSVVPDASVEDSVT